MALPLLVKTHGEWQGDSVVLRGLAFDGHHGFGPNSADESFQGNLVLLSSNQRIDVKNATLRTGHSTIEGYFWELAASRFTLPSRHPFLVTNNDRLQCIYAGQVVVSPKEPFGSVIRDSESELDFLVSGGKRWFGVLQIMPRSTQGTLLAFSAESLVEIWPDTLLLTDRDDQEFGSIAKG